MKKKKEEETPKTMNEGRGKGGKHLTRPGKAASLDRIKEKATFTLRMLPFYITSAFPKGGEEKEKKG